MIRAARTAAYLLAFILALSCFTGCLRLDGGEEGDPIKPAKPPYSTSVPAPTLRPYRSSLVLISKTMQAGGCEVAYPFVCDPGSEMLNLAISSAFTEFAEYCDSPGSSIDYTTEFNRSGLLSFLMTCTSAQGRLLAADTANFDCFAIRRIHLTACFGSGPLPQSRLAELVLEDVRAQGRELLYAMPAPDDTRLFVFTLGGICLFYREYELYPSGEWLVRVRIGLEELEGCIAEDGLLNRLN